MMDRSPRSPIKVIVVDDHDMLRYGVTASLSTFSDIRIVGEATSGVDAIQQCAQLQPDVALVDMKMAGMDGPTTIRALHRMDKTLHIVALTSYGDRDLVHAAISAGAISYLLKNVSAEELANAIRRAHAGQSTLATEATQALVDVTHSPSPHRKLLTNREEQVLSLMVRGSSNAEIAHALTVSYSTAKKHVSNILSKLEASTRSEAVAIALRNNLVRRD